MCNSVVFDRLSVSAIGIYTVRECLDRSRQNFRINFSKIAYIYSQKNYVRYEEN